MAGPVFDDEILSDVEQLSDEEFTKFFEALSPDEKTAFDAAVSKPKAPAPSVGVPNMLNPATATDPMAGWGAPPAAPEPPKPGVAERVWEGLKEAQGSQFLDLWNPVAPVTRAAEAVIQPLKQEYLDPAIREWQKSNREDLGAGADPQALEKIAGEAGAQALRNLGSFVYGPPETYRTPEQQARGERALAQAAITVAQDLLGLAPEHRKKFEYPEQTGIGAFANTATSEAAYLPLYLIDAPGKSSLLTRAAVGGGLSEALDPREGANPIRGMQTAGALGGVFDAVGRLLSRPAQKAVGAVKAMPEVADVPKDAPVAVVPAEEVKALVDAPPAPEPLKAGAKASYVEARKSGHGEVEMRPVQVTPEGGKKAGQWMPVGQKAPARGIVLATEEAAEALKGLDLEGQLLDVVVARDMPAKDLELAPTGVMLDDVSIRTEQGDRTLFSDDAALGLEAIPESDFLVARQVAGGPITFRPVRARNLQRESLTRRSLVEVQTPNGPKLGFYGADADDTRSVIVAPDPVERIPGALENSVAVDRTMYKFVEETKRLNEILDARQALIDAEREAAVRAQDTAIAQQAAAQGVPVVQTPTGAKVALVGDDIAPPAAPPEPPPPGFPPNGDGGDFGGVPLPPVPPDPSIAIGLDTKIDFLQRALSPTLIPPTASGPLDASTAATFYASSRAADAVQGRVEKASQEALRPILTNMSEAKRAAVFRSTADFLEGRKSMRDLLKEHPELGGEVEKMVADARARTQANQKFLEAEGFVQPLKFETPGGGAQMAEFVKTIQQSRTYLAKRYYAYDLKAGKWADYLKRNKAEWDDLVTEYVKDVVGKRARAEGLSPKEQRVIAERELEVYIRDPDAIAEAWNTQRGPGGLKRADASDALKARAGYGLEENLKIFNERAKAWTSEQVDAALQFIAKKGISDDEMATLFHGEDGMKDIKFLKQTQERFESSLPRWMKLALGPVESPFTRYAFTASNQEDLVMRATAIRQLRGSGAIQSAETLAALRPTALNGSASERWVRIPDDPSQFGSAAGHYVHPNYSGFLYYTETVRGFENMFARALSWVARKFKMANTVMSQGAWLSNVLGNFQGMALSGAMSPSDMLRPGGVSDIFGATTDQWRDFVKHPNRVQPGAKTGADWIRESVKYGILQSDFVSAEFRAFLDNAAKHSFPAERNRVTMTDYLLAWMDATKGKAASGARVYGGIDPFFKHANWLAGLKKGGVDIKTGALKDRKAAIDWLDGWGGPRKVLEGMSDAQLAERVKAGSARMIAESHPMPDRIGRIQREAGRIADVTGAVGIGDLFVRTSSEVLRTQLMALPRAFTRPGVAKSMFEYGLLAGTVLGGSYLMKRRMGISPEAERKSYMGLPLQLRQYRPGAYALPVQPDEQGRYTFLDTSRAFDGIKLFNGDPGGRPLIEGLSETPGMMSKMAAFNIAKTYIGLGGGGEEITRDILQSAGILPGLPPDKEALQPGTQALADKMWKLAAPGFAKQAVSAFNSAQGTPTQEGMSLPRAAVQAATGGAIFQGGTTRDAAIQRQILDRQMNEAMQPSLTREGQPLGPFQKYSKEQERQQRMEKVQQIRNIRR